MLIENEGETPEVVETEPVSMEDTIRDTLRGLKEKPEAAEVLATPEAPEEKAQRIRDEQGKFATKVEDAPVVAEVQEPAPVVIPPEIQKLGLRKEEADAFMSAPQALKDAFLRRADEMHKGIEQYRGAAQFAQSMQKAIEPHMETIRGLGVAPEVAIGELLNADHRLRYGTPEQKQMYFAHLAQSYGIDLSQVQSAPPEQYALTAMQQRLQQLEGQLQNQSLMGQKQQEESLNSDIQKFASDPSHSHFEAVRADMAALIQAGRAADLQSAYEQAVWANPVTRASMLEQQIKAQREEATQKAQAAKVAASVNTRARPSMPVSQPIGTMDETIRATLRKLQAA